MLLLNGDCLELMKDIEDKSIDLIFCDLPYGQTSCKWDCCIDLDVFWKEVMRIKKLNTPIFMTTTTKFGVSLINSAPKKCHFRYDLVWVKSAPAGFLSAKKMPMRKHEMIYVFYEKLPFYDLSSHQHKFIKETVNKRNGKDGVDNKGMIKNRSKTEIQNKYDPPLPVSVVKEETGGATGEELSNNKDFSVEVKNSTYGTLQIKQPITSGPRWNPPLPVSVVKEEPKQIIKGEHNTYNTEGRKKPIVREKGGKYETPLPTTMLEIKSTRGKHSTEKPVALMEWIFKYYSKEGDTIFDPTMGSGSTGVACNNMNRNFIGIEKDEEIFKVAVERCGYNVELLSM
jgi:hypothetical protein